MNPEPNCGLSAEEVRRRLAAVVERAVAAKNAA
jgi:hypothetical protein